MNIYAGLDPEAANLVREHDQLFRRLPTTFLVNTLVQIQNWPTLFAAEKKYFVTLFDQLSGLTDSEFAALFGALANFEAKDGLDHLDAADITTLQAEQLNHLRSTGVYSDWRGMIDGIFQKIEPKVEAQLYSSNLPPRLVVIIYGQEIAIERETLWQRFHETGFKIPLSIGAAQTSAPFLEELFTGFPAGSNAQDAPTLFQVLCDSRNFSPLDNWIVEAGADLHRLCERTSKDSTAKTFATGLSYERLRAYRQRLSDAIYSKVSTSDLQGPLQLEAWLETLEAKPHEGLSLYSDHVVVDFVRDIFVLGGNGALIINNSFVEWSSIQALRRAQPRLLVARFGVRDKLKPFSSLLLFSQPRPTDQIPMMQDPLGSFVDTELLSYYIWIKSGESLPFRGKTMYLLLAEGVNQMIAIPPGGVSRLAGAASLKAATLADVAVTMARWLGAEIPSSTGRPIHPLLA